MKKSLLVAIVACTMTACATTHGKEETSAGHRQDALENIFARKSIRKFLPRTVEKGKVDTLLRAAMAAPSGMDRRPWSFVVVDDRKVLDAMAGELANARMLSQAPLAIAVCGDTVVSDYWYLDCANASQNILLAAEAMGLGAVWTASFPYGDRVAVARRHLGLPDHIMPLCIIPIGYPAEEKQPKDKWDGSRIHRNRW